jgi:hypothetical protein
VQCRSSLSSGALPVAVPSVPPDLDQARIRLELSVCPEMIFRLRKPFSNKAANPEYLTGRKTSLFSNFFGNLD